MVLFLINKGYIKKQILIEKRMVYHQKKSTTLFQNLRFLSLIIKTSFLLRPS